MTSKQPAILSFFKPIKRPAGTASSTVNEMPPEKLTKVEDSDVKDKLVDQCNKLKALHPNINPSWFKILSEEFCKPYFHKLSSFLETERKAKTVYPPAEKVWSWTYLPVNSIKVVILGQDPYHGPHQANGMCFSVPPGVRIPPSLLNIYKELSTCIPGFQIPNHGLLHGWLKQGVLLLNTTLTVRAGEASSHSGKGWENLTDSVIKNVNTRCHGVVFLLWGLHAQNKAALIDKNKHFVLKAAHPSPLSAHRGFLGCQHFSKCNDYLQKNGKKPIDWNHLPEK